MSCNCCRFVVVSFSFSDAALAAYEVALKKTVGAGPRIDVVFATLRLALFANDVKLLVRARIGFAGLIV